MREIPRENETCFSYVYFALFWCRVRRMCENARPASTELQYMTIRASMFAALRHRDFRWLWAGTFCSTSGQWIQNATLGWVTYELTGSGTLLGAVLGVRAI